MSQHNLEKIFGAPWFRTGRGERTAEGSHWSFQPFMYFMPLLALYTGGRLNELAQLYLADLRQTQAGVWFVDFNLRDGHDAPRPACERVRGEPSRRSRAR